MLMRQVPDYFYLQSAVIPYRERREGLEVLMITSRKRKRWVMPKGVKEPDLSSQASAAKEALEEAGIEGVVSETAIGSYQYDKWGGTCTVEVFTMRVQNVLEDWEESYRDREWVSVAEAVHRVREPELKRILKRLPDFRRSEVRSSRA